MPKNGLIAFCTFYKNYVQGRFDEKRFKEMKRSKDDRYDYCWKTTSILTRLRFKLKNSLRTTTQIPLVPQFDIILYPNSVFIMSLSTNRLYTHEIIPSILPVEMIPIRMGYVIRCSKTKALYREGQTYLMEEEKKYVKLEKPQTEDIRKLKKQYYQENTTDDIIHYGNIYFSLNEGDYRKPIV